MNRELYFATPIYVKDIGSQEFNNRLEQNIINWSNKASQKCRTRPMAPTLSDEKSVACLVSIVKYHMF